MKTNGLYHANGNLPLSRRLFVTNYTMEGDFIEKSSKYSVNPHGVSWTVGVWGALNWRCYRWRDRSGRKVHVGSKGKRYMFCVEGKRTNGSTFRYLLDMPVIR
jgi:hypothetical protein